MAKLFRTPLGNYETGHGFLLDWYIAGFFHAKTHNGQAPNLFDAKIIDESKRDWLKALGGETSFRDIPKKRGGLPLDWHPVQVDAAYPKFDLDDASAQDPELKKAIPSPWEHQWYALAVLESAADADVELRFSGWDGCRLWWNGELRFEEHSWHWSVFDLHTLPVRLKKGRNTLLFKLDRQGFVARITAPGGGRLKTRVQTLTTQKPAKKSLGAFAAMGDLARHSVVQYPCHAKTKVELNTWRKKALTLFREAVGPMPPRSETGKPRLIRREPLEGYSRLTYHFPDGFGYYLPLYVLVPDKKRFCGSAILCLHGHGQDEQTVAGLIPPSKPYGNWFGPYSGNYAEQLAAAGFLTATYANRGMSKALDDRPPRRNEEGCNLLSLSTLIQGFTLPALHLSDIQAVTQFLQKNFSVAPQRLGITGLSGGGSIAMMAGAYDDRFKAVALFCCLQRYRDYAAQRNICAAQFVPNLFPKLDVGEILSLITPRPLLLGQGAKDKTFDVFALESLANTAQKAYAAAGLSKLPQVVISEWAHQYNVAAAAAFFQESL